MMQTITHSQQLYEEAKQYLPGGVNSPVRAFSSIGDTPRFIKRADGPYLWDEDGCRYIDYVDRKSTRLNSSH